MALLRRRADNPEARMSLGEHFREFRNRLLVAATAILIGGIVGWILYDPVSIGSWRFDGVWNYIIAPMNEYQRRNPGSEIQPNFGQATQAFSLRMKIAFFVGLILSSPVWLWQIWGFLVPGMTKREKKVARLFIVTAVPLFLAGCLFGGTAITNILEVLYNFTPDTATNIVDATYYVNFVTKFILVMGLSFLLPVILMALNTIRILPGRIMLKGWRIAIIGIAVFAAMMSPTPDAWSMFVVMMPMVILYYGACFLAIQIDKRREKKERPDWLDLPDDQASEI